MSILKVKLPNGSRIAGSVKAGDIPIGTVFFGFLAERRVFLRIYDGIVDLENPRKTWTFEGHDRAVTEGVVPTERGPMIRDFMPAVSAELLVT